MKIRAGITGGSGYTGGELLRLLLRHPQVSVTCVHSRQHAGKKVTAVHKDLLGETDLIFSEEPHFEVDVLFLCLGHGESSLFLEQHAVPARVKIIDLSQDFRTTAHGAGRNWVYGLPELYRGQIPNADSVANPGCFATAIQLALLPLARAGVLHDVHITGITGSTGAGTRLQDTLHFSWRTANISAYKTLSHQHIHEVMQSLNYLHPSESKSIYFVPWRGDFARGIFVTAVLNRKGLSGNEVNHLFEDFYRSHPFTVVASEMIDLKMAVNTNKCVVYPEVVGDKIAVHAALDNLLKGASGQAVQNLNLMFGLEETTGLRLKASAF
ncbi:MAG: N-acetyl-gamma-glutamyl-phosphate reductase [Cyclobacteriaceae bacterium]|nr:MAG: N-acetyl-gamma-glutamyl-phosphate reductase [Cyclobacteriaceae bacterium]